MCQDVLALQPNCTLAHAAPSRIWIYTAARDAATLAVGVSLLSKTKVRLFIYFVNSFAHIWLQNLTVSTRKPFCGMQWFTVCTILYHTPAIMATCWGLFFSSLSLCPCGVCAEHSDVPGFPIAVALPILNLSASLISNVSQVCAVGERCCTTCSDSTIKSTGLTDRSDWGPLETLDREKK